MDSELYKKSCRKILKFLLLKFVFYIILMIFSINYIDMNIILKLNITMLLYIIFIGLSIII